MARVGVTGCVAGPAIELPTHRELDSVYDKLLKREHTANRSKSSGSKTKKQESLANADTIAIEMDSPRLKRGTLDNVGSVVGVAGIIVAILATHFA